MTNIAIAGQLASAKRARSTECWMHRVLTNFKIVQPGIIKKNKLWISNLQKTFAQSSWVHKNISTFLFNNSINVSGANPPPPPPPPPHPGLKSWWPTTSVPDWQLYSERRGKMSDTASFTVRGDNGFLISQMKKTVSPWSRDRTNSDVISSIGDWLSMDSPQNLSKLCNPNFNQGVDTWWTRSLVEVTSR